MFIVENVVITVYMAFSCIANMLLEAGLASYHEVQQTSRYVSIWKGKEA